MTERIDCAIAGWLHEGPLSFYNKYFPGVPKKELVVSKCDFGPVPFGQEFLSSGRERDSSGVDYGVKSTYYHTAEEAGMQSYTIEPERTLCHGFGWQLKSTSGEHDWRLGYLRNRQGLVVADLATGQAWKMGPVKQPYNAAPIVAEGAMGWVLTRLGIETEPPKLFVNAVNRRAAWYQAVYSALPRMTYGELREMVDDIYPPWRMLLALNSKADPLEEVQWEPDTRPFLDPPGGWVIVGSRDSADTMKGY